VFLNCAQWFSNFDAVIYAPVEYIPLVGTLYSVKRVDTVYSERDWTRYWQSVADAISGGIRDSIVKTTAAEPLVIAIIHSITVQLTNELIDKYFDASVTPTFRVNKTLNPKEYGYVILAAKDNGHGPANHVFEGKQKGVHLFHNSIFNGIITHEWYAPDHQKIQMHLPSGLYDNAPVQFTWRWTTDSSGVKNRPEHSMGRIRLAEGRPTSFGLTSFEGVGWEGYKFWGTINSLDEIRATTHVGGKDIDIVFKRHRN